MHVCPALASLPRDVGRDALERLPLIDQHRRLAAELERHRHEMLAGGAHNGAADGRAPGEEEVIERQAREGGANGGIAGDDGDFVVREGLREHRQQDVVRRRRELRRFDHGAIASGEGGRERNQGERERIVPRSHDADNAERLILDVGAAEAHEARRARRSRRMKRRRFLFR